MHCSISCGLKRSVTTDSGVSWLHYRLTCILLIFFCILTVGQLLFFDPINCIQRGGDLDKAFLNEWCLVHGTFSVNEAWTKKVGEDIPYPGIDKFGQGSTTTYHTYYRWVPLVLLAQAIMFYIPKFLWNCKENGRIRLLVQDLDSPVLPEDTRSEQRRLLVRGLGNSFQGNNSFFHWFLAVEILNFLNVACQVSLLSSFLGASYQNYGPAIVQFSEGTSPMTRLFPLKGKCSFYRYGASGLPMREDSLCILPMNDLNQKLFAFLWFWFVILATLSGLLLLYRLITTALPRVSIFLTRNPSVRGHLEAVFRVARLGDILILNLLSQNLDSCHFGEVVVDLSCHLNRCQPDVFTKDGDCL